MNQIGRKIYYDKSTGNVLVDTGEMQGDVRETTISEDFTTYIALQGIQQSAIGVVKCDYGYMTANFATYPYHIDITKNSIDETAIVWDTTNPIGATLDDVKKNKITQMQDFYEQAIYGTFQSSAFDGQTMETYSCSLVDQPRINGEVTVAIAVLQGYSTEQLSWKNINQDQCVPWQPKNMIKLGDDLHKFVTEKTDYFEALAVYINKLTSADDVNKVTWGMTIPS